MQIRLAFYVALVINLTGLVTGCITSEPSWEFGLQEGFKGYIPARIAVINCQPWPTKSRFAGQPPLNIDDQSLQALCEEVDQKVLAGFSGQPFMKGYTPKLIAQLLERANQTNLLLEIPRLWEHNPSICKDCNDTIPTYRFSIANNPKWRDWLHAFSNASLHCDAILLPFIVKANEHQYNDRGLYIAERMVRLDLLLIDSNHGKLLWVGSREASSINQKLVSIGDGTYPDYPAWPLIYKRLLTADLWKDFPGHLSEN